MKNFATLQAAQGIADAILIHFNGASWDAYEPGDTLPPAPPASLVPGEVDMRQAQLAMLAFAYPDGTNLLDKVNTLISQQPRTAQVTWNASRAVQRGNPLIAALKPALGLTDAQIDQLFVTAAAL